jgi:putative phage-type endonuclease
MITKIKTNSREEWLELRSHYIGGSDAAAVVGLNPFSSPYALWAEKTGRTPPFAGNLATEVGTYLEEFVAKKFEEETGKKVRRCNLSMVNDLYPWAIANIDREIVGEDAGLEIKTTSDLNLKNFKNGEYPANYYAQMVHYLAVTGKKRWYLAVLIGNREFRWFVLDRDEAEIAALMGAEKAFWQNVENGTPPALDGSAATEEALRGIYAEGSDDISVDLYGCTEYIEQYLDLGSRIRELEAMQTAAANEIKARMGEAGIGMHDKFAVSWKTASRRSFDSKRFAADHKDMDLSGYYSETITRTFRVREIKGV